MKRILLFCFLFLTAAMPAMAEPLEVLIDKAEKGSAPAQIELGRMYLNGQGVKADPYRASFWYRQAANQKDPRGQTALGQLYETGKGVFQSEEQAMKWYAKAANQGFASAQFHLGNLYETSKEGFADPAKARFWYEKAASQGNESAKKNLARMGSGRKAPAPAAAMEAEKKPKQNP